LKQYDLALDISIIKADVSIMTGQPEDTNYRNIMDVAKCLEAMGRMKDAARMYHALAETEPRIQSITLLLTCYNNAGLAYKCAGDFDMAESMYIHAVYHTQVGGSLTFSKNLFELYLNIEEKESKTRTGGTFELGVIYGSLFKACGFKNPNKELERMCCAEYLKPALQKPAAALAAITMMATSPDGNFFREYLQMCKSPSKIIKKFSFDEKHRNDHKKHARKAIKSDSKGAFEIVCDNTGCSARHTPDGRNLGQCGCRSVAYCSRACQKSHWKIHKKSCSLKKQKNGTEGK
jgi:tetratricopeptide (TPR) repeat protein